MLKNELNFELYWNHIEVYFIVITNTYIIENHAKSLMFSIYHVLSSVANICENYNLYSMVYIRNLHNYRQFRYNGGIPYAILTKLRLNYKSGIYDKYRFLKSRIVIDFKNLWLI